MTENDTVIDSDVGTARRDRSAAWFAALRDDICAAFEDLEDALAGRFAERPAGPFPPPRPIYLKSEAFRKWRR